MTTVFSKIWAVSAKHPILRGMVSYAVIWPAASLIQQTISGKRPNNYDWGKCLRFGLYGSLFVAPTLYAWVRLSSTMWPTMNLRSGITKALVEQFSYGPAAMATFFFAMELMEFKSIKDATHEVVVKFYPTWRMGICFWPIFQTINFTLIPERNRVPFVSLGSLIWTIFLAYMKQLEENAKEMERLKGPLKLMNKAE